MQTNTNTTAAATVDCRGCREQHFCECGACMECDTCHCPPERDEALAAMWDAEHRSLGYD